YLDERVPRVDAIFVQLAGDQGKGSDNTAFSNKSSVQYYTVNSDPNVVLDHNPALAGDKCLVSDGFVSIAKLMVNRSHSTVCGNKDIFPDSNSVATVNDGSRVDVTIPAYGNFARSACRFYFDE